MSSSAPCTSFPRTIAEFTRTRLDGLRTLLGAAGSVAAYNAIVREVDNRTLSKFVHGETSLDYRTMGPVLGAVYTGVYRFYRRSAPEHMVADLWHLLTRVYAPHKADRVEEFSWAMHRMYGVRDYSDQGGTVGSLARIGSTATGRRSTGARRSSNRVS